MLKGRWASPPRSTTVFPHTEAVGFESLTVHHEAAVQGPSATADRPVLTECGKAIWRGTDSTDSYSASLGAAKTRNAQLPTGSCDALAAKRRTRPHSAGKPRHASDDRPAKSRRHRYGGTLSKLPKLG